MKVHEGDNGSGVVLHREFCGACGSGLLEYGVSMILGPFSCIAFEKVIGARRGLLIFTKIFLFREIFWSLMGVNLLAWMWLSKVFWCYHGKCWGFHLRLLRDNGQPGGAAAEGRIVLQVYG